jgi:hypothetical protein
LNNTVFTGYSPASAKEAHQYVTKKGSNRPFNGWQRQTESEICNNVGFESNNLSEGPAIPAR